MNMRTLPVKTTRINLTEEYEGWWFEFRTNPPVGQFIDAMAEFQSADVNNIKSIIPVVFNMLGLILTSWNFVDEKGKNLPPDISGMKRLPFDLIIILANKATEVVAQVPLARSSN